MRALDAVIEWVWLVLAYRAERGRQGLRRVRDYALGRADAWGRR